MAYPGARIGELGSGRVTAKQRLKECEIC